MPARRASVICLLMLAALGLSVPLRAEDASPSGEAATKDAPAAPPPNRDAAAPKQDAQPQQSQQQPEQAPPQQASPPQVSPPTESAGNGDTRESICLMIESAAKANDLPLEFFARVIWQESRFQPDAIGPLTRSGSRAQGIAQFMPGTANERRLLDPFDPVQALPKSAEFLSELRGQFGNLGLAAAAYNAGPRRVQDWIAGNGYLPQETRNYVSAITGTSVDDWAAIGRNGKAAEPAPATSCRTLMALLTRAPNPFVTQLAERVKLGADRPWGVQLAAGFNRDRALSLYARAMTRLGSVIGDQDPNLLGSVWRSRGTRTFYQVRIGAETRGAADNLCSKIRRAGGACLVLRNARLNG